MAKSPPLLVIRYHLQVSTAKRYMGCTSKPQALPYSTDTHWSPFPIFFFARRPWFFAAGTRGTALYLPHQKARWAWAESTT